MADDGAPLVVPAVVRASAEAAGANREIISAALTEGTEPRPPDPGREVLDLEAIGTGGTVTTDTARSADLPLASWTTLVRSRRFPPC